MRVSNQSCPGSQPAKAGATADSGFEAILSLAASLRDLQQQMARHYAPIVRRLVDRRSRDANEIEHTLDRLLDCAGTPAGLALFKSLCRHYYDLDPAAAAEYVMAYREWYDAETIEPAATPGNARLQPGSSSGNPTPHSTAAPRRARQDNSARLEPGVPRKEGSGYGG